MQKIIYFDTTKQRMYVRERKVRFTEKIHDGSQWQKKRVTGKERVDIEIISTPSLEEAAALIHEEIGEGWSELKLVAINFGMKGAAMLAGNLPPSVKTIYLVKTPHGTTVYHGYNDIEWERFKHTPRYKIIEGDLKGLVLERSPHHAKNIEALVTLAASRK